MLLVTPTALFVSMFSKELVSLIYGEGFYLAIPCLSLYALFYSVYPLLLVEISYFNGVGLPRKTLMINFLIFLSVLPLSPLLASVLNVIGVILSIIVANLVAMGYATYFLTKKEGMSFGIGRIVRTYVSAVVSVILSSTLVKAFSLNPILSLLIGGAAFLLLYITLVAMLGGLDRRDYVNLRGMLGGLRIIGRFIVGFVDYMELVGERVRKVKSQVFFRSSPNKT